MEEIDFSYIKKIVFIKNIIRKSIPKRYSPLDKFILRMVQFYSGIKSEIPTIHYIVLEIYLEGSGFDLNESEMHSYINELDNNVWNFCVRSNLTDGAKQWSAQLS